MTSVQEARRAEIVQEAVRFGHWLVPHLNGQPYVTKPPLHPWLAGALAWALGLSEPVLRLPSLLSAAGILALTYLLARRLGGTLAAFLALLFLLAAPRFYFFAHRVELEMLLAFFFTAYLYGAFLYLRSGNLRPLLWAFLSFSAGLLTKGPFILLALSPVVAFGFLTRERRTLSLLHPLALLLSATPALAWYLYLYHRLGGGNFGEFVRVDLLGRLTTGKRDPFYHYAGALLLGFLPESLLLLRAQAFLRLHLAERDRLFLLLCWLVPLLLLSFTAAKFSKYLLSLYPFFAISLALAAANWFREKERLVRQVALFLALGLLVGALFSEIRGNALRFESLKRARPYLSAPKVYFYGRPNYLLVFYRGGPIPVLKGPPFPPGIILQETRQGLAPLDQGLQFLREISPFYRKGKVLRVYSSAGASSASSGSGK
ncbi:ArnT family glycosyltransferase [Thermosulfurimonas marina]|uniref:ArnT family glycosyltransferase n=1 Tax=Thermosulfurimonas marina TaxID=2047767 RepID=UPI00144A72C1|nr:glycosyltransferase family 39 protein [Thermosulfurimonas marina]